VAKFPGGKKRKIVLHRQKKAISGVILSKKKKLSDRGLEKITSPTDSSLCEEKGRPRSKFGAGEKKGDVHVSQGRGPGAAR